MKLAVNYSKILVELIAEHPELPVDYIKVPTSPLPESLTQFETGQRLRKLLPHLAQNEVLLLGHPDPKQRFNPDLVIKTLKMANPPFLSTHIEARVSFLPQYKEQQHQNNPEVKKRLLSRFVDAIREVRDKVGIPLVVENFPYYTWGSQCRVASEAEFLMEVCETADCGFLLDIAHARCTAWHLGLEVHDYLTALPLHRLAEIHMSGSMLRDGEGMRDTHVEMSAIDYDLLDFLLERAKPEILTIEYGGLPEEITSPQGKVEPIERNKPDQLLKMVEEISSRIKLANHTCLHVKE